MGIQQLSQPIVGVLVVDLLPLMMMGFAQLAQPLILITVVRNCDCSDSGRRRRVAKFVTSTRDGQQWWPKGGRHSCRRGTGTPRLVPNSHFFRGQQHRYMTTPYNSNTPQDKPLRNFDMPPPPRETYSHTTTHSWRPFPPAPGKKTSDVDMISSTRFLARFITRGLRNPCH